MKYTENYGFDKPEGTDFVDVEHFNANTEQLDKLLCPEYTEEKTIAELQSGEKLSTAFGKLAKAVKDLISHLADKVVHITSNERTLWNTVSNKADSNHTHKYAGSSSAGGAANSAKTLYYTRYIDGIPFDGSSNLSRLGTCTTATYMADKEVAISAFDDEGAQDAILYIQFTATYEGALNDAHAISINGGEPLTIYYKGEVFNWEMYFSNYPFCEGQIHQFRYFWTPMGSYLELIAPQNRAVANNLTTTNEKIALAAPMGKQLAETDASLQEQISTLNSKSLVYTTTGQQEEITTQQWLNYLVSIGELVTGIITERKMMCQWSYPNNKILSDTPVKISLAGCIIELYGIYTGDLSSVHNNFMIRLTGSPAVASAYTSSKNKVYVFRAVGGLTDWLELTS